MKLRSRKKKEDSELKKYLYRYTIDTQYYWSLEVSPNLSLLLKNIFKSSRIIKSLWVSFGFCLC